MLRIRLTRVGKKKQPSYRIVVADVEARRDGRIVERIGHYNPMAASEEVRIDEGRALYWLSVGAQPSDAVKQLLRRQGTLRRFSRLKEGESLEALVAEYEGATAGSADVKAVAEARAAAGRPAAVAAAAVATATEEE